MVPMLNLEGHQTEFLSKSLTSDLFLLRVNDVRGNYSLLLMNLILIISYF